ncbi:MAG: LacI family DNA-binding transcriptional regulator [Undibacterium sp.]|nr:LacI family DNA-binding transcriptional regulator [Opitutaceae bacterium]
MAASRPTLRSLAAEAGVSPMTVSLALRHSREVSVATRRRLQRLAARRGYRPDPTITKLMHHLRARVPARFKASICGLKQGWADERIRAGNYVLRLEHGLRERADALGYGLNVLDIDDYPAPGQLERVLLSRGIEGLVVMPLRCPCDLTALLDWQAFSTVSATPSLSAPKFHSVMPHHFENMLEACAELTRSGFRRIGLALTKDWDQRVHHRWSGGLAWHNLFGGRPPVAPFIDPQTGPNVTPQAFFAWIGAERPDVILCETHDRAAFSVMLKSLSARRRPVIATLNWPNPPATEGIDQRPERIGAVVIEVLAGMLTRGEKGVPALPNTTMIDGRWAVGRRWPGGK